ncbi:MAG: DNA-3-methyladenine glycosylase I [Candidatus Macondimonas sp.]
MMSLDACPWCGQDPLYRQYHDTEWGVPVHTDRTLFEFLILEGAQAGLSWLTILRKRAHYRRLFADFDVEQVARFDAARVETLLQDPGIVRNRLKVQAAVSNAQAFLAVQEACGSFDRYIWDFVDRRPIVNHFERLDQVPAVTPLAATISRDLKRRGFRFVGPTIVYAHMQATGMVNDHLVDCPRHAACAALA